MSKFGVKGSSCQIIVRTGCGILVTDTCEIKFTAIIPMAIVVMDIRSNTPITSDTASSCIIIIECSLLCQPGLTMPQVQVFSG